MSSLNWQEGGIDNTTIWGWHKGYFLQMEGYKILEAKKRIWGFEYTVEELQMFQGWTIKYIRREFINSIIRHIKS